MPTPKQEKLIRLLLDNLGNKKNTKTFREMILEAGYEESMAKKSLSDGQRTSKNVKEL